MNQDLSMYRPAAFSIIYGLENTGCSSPEKRAAEAEAEIAEEKVNIMKKYSECIEKNAGKKDVSEKCAPYKEASETFISK